MGLAACALAAVLGIGAGCGGEAQAEPPSFTAAQVERMIVRSIVPTLERNLGEGSTVRAACAPEVDYAYRCTATLLPEGDAASPMRVVYRVECDERTCRWNPTG